MKKYLSIIFLLIFFVCLFTFPATLHLSDRIIGDGGDNYQFLGFQYIAKMQFENGVFPFGWTNYWRYPVGFDFSIGYDSTLLLLLGIIFYQFFENPVVVYNLSVLTILFLNGILSYLFFAKITKRDDLGILGSLIYGFSFYSIARLGGHPNLVLTGSFPFLIYGLILIKERKGDKKSFLIFTLSLIMVFLASLQYLLILTAALLLTFPVLINFYKSKVIQYLSLFWNRKKYTFFSLLITFGIFLFFNAGRIEQMISKSLLSLGGDYMIWMSPRLINFFIPNHYLKVIISSQQFPKVDGTGIEGAVFLGYLEVFIFFYFILSRINQKVKLFIFLCVFEFFIISLGCKNAYHFIYPYCYMFKFFPFKGIAESGRFYVVFYLFLTIAILIILKRLKGYKRHLIITLVLFIVVFERIPTNFYLSATLEDEVFIRTVRSLNSDAVLDLPTISQWTGTRQKSRYDLYSVYYQKPIVNGYIHWSGSTPTTETFLDKLSSFQCGSKAYVNNIEINKKILLMLKLNGIKTVVLHKNLDDMDEESYCDGAIENINSFLYQSGIEIVNVYEDEQKTVFQLL